MDRQLITVREIRIVSWTDSNSFVWLTAKENAMASRILVQCPECFTKLSLPDSNRLGKKIKCGICGEVFIAEAFDDFAEDSKSAKPSVRAKRKPVTGKRKNKASRHGNNSSLIVAGVIAVLILIGTGLHFAGVFREKPQVAQPTPIEPAAAVPTVQVVEPAKENPVERKLALRWMPPETEFVLHLKIAELWRAPLLRPLLEIPPVVETVTAFQNITGLLPTDLESVNVGLPEIQGLQAIAGSAMMGFAPTSFPPQMLAVVRTRKPFSGDLLTKSLVEYKPASHNGKNYYESTNAGAIAVWIVDSTTVLIAVPDVLKVAMDRGETVRRDKELMAMESDHHLLLIVSPNNPLELTNGIEMPREGDDPVLHETITALKQSL
ncbi:MAG: zinc-ribbon domain-containing protein [Verrucomicrobiota bacterium]